MQNLRLVRSPLPHEPRRHPTSQGGVDGELRSLLAQFGYDGLAAEKALHFSREVQKLGITSAQLAEMLRKLEAPI